jgi:hypothetical protein
LKSLIAIPIFALAILFTQSYAQETDYFLSASGYKISNDAANKMTLDFQLEMTSPANPVLRQGTLVLDDKERAIENFNLIFYRDGRLFRLNAESDDLTIRANGRMLVSNQEGSIYQLSGATTRDGVSERFLLVAILKPIEEQKTVDFAAILPEKETVAEKEDVLVLVRHVDRVEWMGLYKFTVRTFDPLLNSFSDFYKTSGYLEGVPISAKITDPLGNVIETSSGETQKFGYYEASLLIPDNSRTGAYVLNVTVSGEKFKASSKEMTFFVTPPRSDGSSTP